MEEYRAILVANILAKIFMVFFFPLLVVIGFVSLLVSYPCYEASYPYYEYVGDILTRVYFHVSETYRPISYPYYEVLYLYDGYVRGILTRFFFHVSETY